jgi:hypothetical protein
LGRSEKGRWAMGRTYIFTVIMLGIHTSTSPASVWIQDNAEYDDYQSEAAQHQLSIL